MIHSQQHLDPNENNGHVAPYAFADGARVPLAGDHSEEEFLQQLCSRHGLNLATVMEIYSEIQEHESATTSVAVVPERVREFYQQVKTGLAMLLSYPGDRRMAEHCLAYVLDFKDIAGGQSVVEMARAISTRRHRFSKARVNKCVLLFQKRMNFPALSGQRDPQARLNMTQARERQLRNAEVSEAADKKR